MPKDVFPSPQTDESIDLDRPTKPTEIQIEDHEPKTPEIDNLLQDSQMEVEVKEMDKALAESTKQLPLVKMLEVRPEGLKDSHETNQTDESAGDAVNGVAGVSGTNTKAKNFDKLARALEEVRVGAIGQNGLQMVAGDEDEDDEDQQSSYISLGGSLDSQESNKDIFGENDPDHLQGGGKEEDDDDDDDEVVKVPEEILRKQMLLKSELLGGGSKFKKKDKAGELEVLENDPVEDVVDLVKEGLDDFDGGDKEPENGLGTTGPEILSKAIKTISKKIRKQKRPVELLNDVDDVEITKEVKSGAQKSEFIDLPENPISSNFGVKEPQEIQKTATRDKPRAQRAPEPDPVRSKNSARLIQPIQKNSLRGSTINPPTTANRSNSSHRLLKPAPASALRPESLLTEYKSIRAMRDKKSKEQEQASKLRQTKADAEEEKRQTPLEPPESSESEKSLKLSKSPKIELSDPGRLPDVQESLNLDSVYTPQSPNYLKKRLIQDMESSLTQREHQTFYYDSGDLYTGDVLNEERDGYGVMEYTEGRRYEGNWLRDKKHGFGREYDAFGELIYEGEYRNGDFSGRGTMYDGQFIYRAEFTNYGPTGQNAEIYDYGWNLRYKGALKDGRMHGNGSYYYSNGSSYIGEFFDDKMHGRGTLTFPNGKEYVGGFKNGEMSGFGKIFDKDGLLLFEGEFRQNKPQGRGTEYFSDGRMYVGEFLRGKKHGVGKIYSDSDDLIYEGEFKNGKIHGKGALYYENGDMFKGGFLNNKKHGNGILKKKRGGYFQGNWSYGKKSIVGKGKVFLADGTMYEGQLFGGLAHGVGVQVEPDGTSYEGMFVKGLFQGQGTLRIGGSGGRYYVGQFRQGRPHGYGEMFGGDGVLIKRGNWVNGGLLG